MKVFLLAILSFTSISSFAAISFTLPCKLTTFNSKDKEVIISHPDAKSYNAVKSVFKKNGKWDAEYSIHVTLKTGKVVKLLLTPSFNGDEDYNEYHVVDKLQELSDKYWVSSGSVQNSFQWANFQGNDSRGENIYLRCSL